MADVEHRNLTGASLHEPKGAAAATVGQVYVADGAASGAWAAQSGATAPKLLSTQTASGSAYLDFTSLITSDYDRYTFVLKRIVPANTSVVLNMLTSTNNGVGFDTGGSDYTNAVEHGAPATAAAIPLTGTISTAAAGYAARGKIELFDPLDTNTYTCMKADTFFNLNTDYHVMSSRDSAADVDAVRFIFSAGNITSGSIEMWGHPNA